MANKTYIAQGGDESYLSHLDPRMQIKDIIPAALTGGIKLSQTQTISSAEVLDKAMRMGAQIDEVPVPAYGSRSEGRPRKLDNSDCLEGYAPIYGNDLSLLRKVHHQVGGYISFVEEKLGGNSALNVLIKSLEDQDLTKITQQRWRPPGWFVHLPFSEQIKKDAYSKEFVTVLSAVLAKYAASAGVKRAGWNEIIALMKTDFDPPDTSTGMPTLQSGTATQPAREATLRALPSPVGLTPKQWLDAFSALGVRAGLPYDIAFASTLATRHGPTRKPVQLWLRGNNGYQSSWSSIGLYDRTRFVYPIPHALNFMLSSAYVQLKTARMGILGLWHDPDRMAKYIPALKSQGTYVYTADFSGMDTTMPPHLIKLICLIAIQAGFVEWPLRLLIEATERMSLLMPSFYGNFDSSTSFKGLLGWMSGWKLTSEMDTIFGLTTILTALQCQIPDVVSQWQSGRFIILEQGDDILFVTKKPIDIDRVAKDAQQIAGASLKILENDVLFLKRVLPLTPQIPNLTRTFARVVQQTFFNEDRYSGEKGGDKPPALLRLALLARLESLDKHPMFSSLWPPLAEIISSLVYVQDSSPGYKSDLLKGRFRLDDGDEQKIRQFAMQNDDYLSKLMDRAKFEPSAARFIDLLSKLGVNLALNLQLKNRQILLDGMAAQPTAQDVHHLLSFMGWVTRV